MRVHIVKEVSEENSINAKNYKIKKSDPVRYKKNLKENPLNFYIYTMVLNSDHIAK